MQKLFHDAGYQTGSVGKLHYFPPTAEHARSTGFDRVLLDDGISATDRYSDYVKWRKSLDPQAAIPYLATAKNSRNPFRGAIPYEFTPTYWTGAETCRLLREFAASPKPFLLHCSFFKPHAPYTVPEPFDGMYSDIEIPLPRRVTLAEIEKLPLPVRKQILRFEPRYAMDRRRLEWIYRSYYGSVSMVDREVGRILEELERSGRARDTIVIFATDHGDQLLEHGLEGKNLFFEASVHVPFLVRFPGRVRPGKYDDLIEMVDVLPSLLQWCGMDIPVRVQGRSFTGLVNAGAYDPRKVAFAENIIPEVITGEGRDYAYTPGKGIKGIRHPDAKMARTKRWKLNYYPGNGGELYDIENDPGEMRNVYSDVAHQGTVRDLKAAILDWMITSDETDQIAPRWLLE